MSATLELRDYQRGVLAQIRAAWSRGHNRVCLWLPTGGGKTEVACALALGERDGGGHTLFIVERKTLCAQGVARFQKYGMLAGMLRGEDTDLRGYEPVTVASVQSLRSRDKHEPVKALLERVTLLIVDEAHVLHKYHDEIFDSLPNARGVGLTATPMREGLGLRYSSLIRGPSYADMIRDGHLVKARYFMPDSIGLLDGLKQAKVASTGDFASEGLSSLMRRKTIMGDVVGVLLERGEGRRTICFCVDIAHSRLLADEFAQAGVRAEHIDCFTPDEDRADIFSRFAQGKTQVLCSVGVLALGFDQPQVECVILARPTLSTIMHIQQIGRGWRPYPEKSDCLVFDHALNVSRHGYIEDFTPPELNDVNRRSDRKSRDDVSDYRPCPACRAIMAPKQRVCGECGHAVTAQCGGLRTGRSSRAK
ncbi:MAG: DEAD/DEAH box helicase [Gammaproteobacteria bacterium]